MYQVLDNELLDGGFCNTETQNLKQMQCSHWFWADIKKRKDKQNINWGKSVVICRGKRRPVQQTNLFLQRAENMVYRIFFLFQGHIFKDQMNLCFHVGCQQVSLEHSKIKLSFYLNKLPCATRSPCIPVLQGKSQFGVCWLCVIFPG